MPSPSTDAELGAVPPVIAWRPAGPRREGRLGRIVLVSVGVHLILAWFLTQVEFGRQLVQRVVSVSMVERKRPPKPPPPKPQRKPRPRLEAKARPQPQPQTRPQTALAPAEAGAGGVGIIDDGSGTGTLEVPVGGGLDLPASPSAPAPLILEVGDGEGIAAVTRQPEPIGGLRLAYPEVARVGGLQGDAEVQAWVDAQGFVKMAILRRASSPLFGRAALEAVRLSRFLPALRSGVPVASTIRIPVRFTLNAARVPEATASFAFEGDDAEAPEEASTDVEVMPMPQESASGDVPPEAIEASSRSEVVVSPASEFLPAGSPPAPAADPAAVRAGPTMEEQP